MSEIERKYPYQPGWLTVIACGLLFGACTVWLGYIAATNQRGLSLFRVVTLAPSEATVFLWALTASMLPSRVAFDKVCDILSDRVQA